MAGDDGDDTKRSMSKCWLNNVRDILLSYGGWASEILHQLKTVVNIPLFCLGFNHPVGDANIFATIHSSSSLNINNHY